MPDKASVGFDVAQFREVAYLEAQDHIGNGVRLDIGTRAACPASELSHIWKDDALCDAFIDEQKLEAFVLSDSPATRQAVGQSGIVRQDPTASGRVAGTYEKFEQWQSHLTTNMPAFLRALTKAIDGYREETTGTRSPGSASQTLTTEPKLRPNDPENFLSDAARRRVRDAFLENEAIRRRALAKVGTHLESLSSPRPSLSEYCKTGWARRHLEQFHIYYRRLWRISSALGRWQEPTGMICAAS